MCHPLKLLVVWTVAMLATEARADRPRSLSGHTKAVTSIAFLGDGKVLASASTDNSVKLWNIANGTELATLVGHGAGVQAVAATRDAKYLASGDKDGVLWLWDVKTRKDILTLKGQKGDVAAIAFSPNGEILAAGGGGYDKEAKKGWSEIRLRETRTGKEFAQLEEHETRVTSLAFGPDGKTLASCSADGTVLLWNVEKRQKIFALGKNPQGASGLAFRSDGQVVACGSFVGSTVIKFWDTKNGKEMRTLEDEFGPSTLSLAFLPDGKTLAVGGLSDILDPSTRGAYLGLWDVEVGKERMVLKGHWRAVLCVAVDRDGETLAAGGLDGVVRVWELGETEGKE